MSSSLQRVLRRAARRDFVAHALDRTATTLLVGLAVAWLAFAAGRLLGSPVAARWHAVVGVAAFAWGLALAWRGRLREGELARVIDRHLRLADRLSSAAVLGRGASGRHDPDFARLVVRDGERLADRLDARGALPIRLPARWVVVVCGAVLLAVAECNVPPMTWGAESRGGALDQAARAADDTKADLGATVERALDEGLAPLEEEPQHALGGASQEEIEALRDLARQLADTNADEADGAEPPLDEDLARDESIDRFGELADQLDRDAERAIAAEEALVRRFSGAEPPEGLPDAEEFLDALRRGAYGDAADRIERMLDDAENREPAERREHAEAVKELARSLAERAEPGESDRAAEEQRAVLDEALRDQGIDPERLDELLGEDAPPGDPIAEELEREGMDEELARNLARDVEKLRERLAADEQAREEASELARSLAEAADALEDEPTAPADEQELQERAANESETEPKPEPKPTEGDAREPSSEAREQESPQADGEKREGAAEPARSENRERGEEQAPASKQRRDASGSEQREQGAQQKQIPDAKGEGTEQDAQQKQVPDAKGEGPERGAQPKQVGEGGRTPSEVLREIERRRSGANAWKQAAKRFRDTARKLAGAPGNEDDRRWGDASPREREGSEPGVGAQAPREREESAAAAPRELPSKDVDLGGNEPAERTAAEWAGGEGVPHEPSAVTATEARRLRRSAERAIEDSAIPTRYHRLIRRYFERLEESAGEEAPAAPAAPD